jgi:uncharacterized protein DUF4386
MTRTSNARLAGFMFLFYIAVGALQGIIGSGSSAGPDIAARLASVAGHAAQIRTNALLGLLMSFIALFLAVGLFGLTREVDEDLATLGLSCRVGEGLMGALPSMASLTLLSLATQGTDAGGVAYAASAIFRFRSLATLIGSIFFAVGSTVFAYLLLRGSVVPRVLAWLGIVSSLLLVVALPLQVVGLLTGVGTQVIWAPAAAFEIPLGVWLMVRSAAIPAPGSAAPRLWRT